MIRRRTAAIAAGVVLLIGGVAAGCSAAEADDTRDGPRAGAPADNRPERDTSQLVTALVEGLGVDKAAAQDAVDEAMSQVMGDRDRGDKPADGTTPSAPPSSQPSAPSSGTPSAPQEAPTDDGDGRSGLAADLAAVIADELDADEAKVLEIVKQNLPEAPDRDGDGRGPGKGGDRGDDRGNGSEPSPQPSTTP